MSYKARVFITASRQILVDSLDPLVFCLPVLPYFAKLREVYL